MLKAAREAKLHTSWTMPKENYEKSLMLFIEKTLADQEFIEKFLPFQKEISFFGKMNSLSQTVLKLTLPGVPDIYQGCELWDFSLVDPDNRRPVNFGIRKQYLQEIQNGITQGKNVIKFVQSLVDNSDDGRIKMYIIHQLLHLRKNFPELFKQGNYIPLKITGNKSNHVIAFRREYQNQQVTVITGRFFASLNGSDNFTGKKTWEDTFVHVDRSADSYNDVITGIQHYYGTEEKLSISTIFSQLPFSVLISTVRK